MNCNDWIKPGEVIAAMVVTYGIEVRNKAKDSEPNQ